MPMLDEQNHKVYSRLSEKSLQTSTQPSASVPNVAYVSDALGA